MTFQDGHAEIGTRRNEACLSYSGVINSGVSQRRIKGALDCSRNTANGMISIAVRPRGKRVG